MLLKVGALSIVGIPSTSRHSPTAVFPCFHAHTPNLSCPSYPASKPKFRALGVPRLGSGIVGSGKGGSLEDFAAEFDVAEKEEDLSVGGEIYLSTLRLNYFGCFFGLPIIISSMRLGISAGRKTMVATAVLLFVISGPLKVLTYLVISLEFLARFVVGGMEDLVAAYAWYSWIFHGHFVEVATAVLLFVLSGLLKVLTYLLMHGILGFSMGTLWRLGASWRVSISICTLVRALCALGYALISSFLIRENILDLITINLHTLLAYPFVSLGVNSFPSMGLIYAIFGFVLLLNPVFLVFLLHLLYSMLLSRLG